MSALSIGRPKNFAIRIWAASTGAALSCARDDRDDFV
jgi:hypothetical protein